MKSVKYIVVLSALMSALPALAKLPITVSLPKAAKPGQAVTISVKTEKNAKCKIEAQDVGWTQSMKLNDQNADNSGRVKWKFSLPKDYKANEIPIIITVNKNNQEEKVMKSIAIKR